MQAYWQKYSGELFTYLNYLNQRRRNNKQIFLISLEQKPKMIDTTFLKSRYLKKMSKCMCTHHFYTCKPKNKFYNIQLKCLVSGLSTASFISPNITGPWHWVARAQQVPLITSVAFTEQIKHLSCPRRPKTGCNIPNSLRAPSRGG